MDKAIPLFLHQPDPCKRMSLCHKAAMTGIGISRDWAVVTACQMVHLEVLSPSIECPAGAS